MSLCFGADCRFVIEKSHCGEDDKLIVRYCKELEKKWRGIPRAELFRTLECERMGSSVALSSLKSSGMSPTSVRQA